jgi:hypothetical protein
MSHGGNTGGHNAGVSSCRWSALASRNSLKNQRPPLARDGRLLLGSWHSTPELRPRGYRCVTHMVGLAASAHGANGGDTLLCLQDTQPLPPT